MFEGYRSIFESTLRDIEAQGLTKRERVITTPQGAEIETTAGAPVLNFCANNYLGLANHPRVIAAAKRALDEHGFGLASVRFICGTQDIHKALEERISAYLGVEDTILYSSCFDANGGLFETILGEEDAIISDQLNHASIIDGIRLAKAARFRYAHGAMDELERHLQETSGHRIRLIATDGVFSMDGSYAKLDQICALAERYQALVMIDDCHATGFVGKTGRGTPEHCGVQGRVDIITGTLGKALGGASGGYISGKKPIIDLLRQRSRPYLFSNTLAPSIVGASIEVLAMLSGSTEWRDQLEANTRRFRDGITSLGFTVKPGSHPITPVMLGDARLASEMADELLREGIYVIGFSFPVVPKGEARIRVQLSAAHTAEQIDRCLAAFEKVGRARGVI